MQDRKKRQQDVSDDGAIYMFPSVYSCIGITYNKTLLEAHGWELPKFFADLETWQRKQRRRGTAVPGTDRISAKIEVKYVWIF